MSAQGVVIHKSYNTSENLYRISVINWGHPEKKCPHRGWLSIKVTTQLKTSKNSWEHWQTSKIIWYHPQNNWGPIIDNLVQFEEDFNSRTMMMMMTTMMCLGWARQQQSRDHDLNPIRTVSIAYQLLNYTAPYQAPLVSGTFLRFFSHSFVLFCILQYTALICIKMIIRKKLFSFSKW